MTATAVCGRNGTTMAGPSFDCPPYFSLSARARGSELLVTARGELDAACVPAVAAMFSELAPPGCRRAVIDVSGLEFVDNAGLRALLSGPPSLDDDFQVALRAPSRPVLRLLELTGYEVSLQAAGHGRARRVAHSPGDARSSQQECG